MDLGGASTQITFVASQDIIADMYSLQISSAVRQNVYTHSFLYYGVNEAQNRYHPCVLCPVLCPVLCAVPRSLCCALFAVLCPVFVPWYT